MWLNAKDKTLSIWWWLEGCDFRKYLIPYTCCWMQKTRPYQDDNDMKTWLLKIPNTYLWLNAKDKTLLRLRWHKACDVRKYLVKNRYILDNNKLASTQQQKICWHWHVARIISSQKIYGLYARKHHIVEIVGDVTDAGRTNERTTTNKWR